MRVLCTSQTHLHLSIRSVSKCICIWASIRKSAHGCLCINASFLFESIHKKTLKFVHELYISFENKSSFLLEGCHMCWLHDWPTAFYFSHPNNYGSVNNIMVSVKFIYLRKETTSWRRYLDDCCIYVHENGNLPKGYVCCLIRQLILFRKWSTGCLLCLINHKFQLED